MAGTPQYIRFVPWNGPPYQHAAYEGILSKQRTTLFNEAGQIYGFKDRYQVNGFLQSDNAQDLQLAIAALRQAYDSNGTFFGLYNSDGSLTDFFLNGAASVGGIKVVQQPSFPDMKGAALSTFVPYTIVVEAEFRDATVNLISFQETVHFRGGGPRFKYMQTLRGISPKQIVALNTPFTAMQRGSQVGQFFYPPYPAPLWPADVHVDEIVTEPKSPKAHKIGSVGVTIWTEFPIEYSYPHESSAPLIGVPNRWR